MRKKYVSLLALNNRKAFNYLPLTSVKGIEPCTFFFSPSVAACNLLWLFLYSQSPILLVCNKAAVRIFQPCSCFLSWDSGISKAIPSYHSREITLGCCPLRKVWWLGVFCWAFCFLFPWKFYFFLDHEVRMNIHIRWLFIWFTQLFCSHTIKCFCDTF